MDLRPFGVESDHPSAPSRRVAYLHPKCQTTITVGYRFRSLRSSGGDRSSEAAEVRVDGVRLQHFRLQPQRPPSALAALYYDSDISHIVTNHRALRLVPCPTSRIWSAALHHMSSRTCICCFVLRSCPTNIYDFLSFAQRAKSYVGWEHVTSRLSGTRTRH